MKFFDDFLKTLTEDEISEIMNECQEPLTTIREQSSGSTAFGNQIGTISYFVSLGLLRRYHEWLQQ